MTIKDFIQLVIRRWYIFAAGIIFTVVSILGMQSEPQIFVANTEIVMVPPGTSKDFEPPEDTRDTLISFADVVSRKFNDEHPTIHLSSPSATLFGNGVRDGSSASLLNTGTQWQAAFSGPVISVQVLGSSDLDVREKINIIIDGVKDTTRDLQDHEGLKANSHIMAETDPTRIQSSSFGPTRSSKLKGNVLLFCFALCISMIVARGLDAQSTRCARRTRLRHAILVQDTSVPRENTPRRTAK